MAYDVTSLVSIPVWIGIIYGTFRKAEKISSFIERKAKKKTTKAVIEYLKRPRQTVSVFAATQATLPPVGGGFGPAVVRLKRFLALYALVGVVTVFSFGLLEGLAEKEDGARLFLGDHVALLPGAFLTSWLVAAAVSRSLARESLAAFGAGLAVSASLAFLYAVCWSQYRFSMPAGELLDHAVAQLGGLTFLDPRMELVSFDLMDRFGNVVTRPLTPGEVGFPAQYKVSAFRSDFIVYVSVAAEAAFAAVTAVWLAAFGRIEAVRVWLAEHFAVKDDPYLYAVIPPILAVEFVCLLVAIVMAIVPRG